MLSCKHIAEYATDYMEGRMNFWQRLKFRSHLRACVHCGRFLKHIGLTCIVSGSCSHQTASDQEVEAILEMVRAA
jgi:hypothetical protein